MIALVQIDLFDLLVQLFGGVLIPAAVAQETATSVPRPAWLIERALSQPLDARIVDADIGPGEREAISLGLEVDAGDVILDDRRSRIVARQLGLSVIGTLGVLRLAKRNGLIGALRPLLENLTTVEFWMSAALLETVLAEEGED